MVIIKDSLLSEFGFDNKCANSKLIEHIVEFESCQSSLSLPLMDGFLALFLHEIVFKIFP